MADRKKTIGFYGDSFCYHVDKGSWPHTVAKYFNATIINKGILGSSHWSIILDQYPANSWKTHNGNVDYAVFCWTQPGRLYNRHVSNLNFASVYNPPPKSKNSKIWKSAKSYYDNLIDYRKENYEYEASIKKFVQQLPKDIPTVHLWSMANSAVEGQNLNDFSPSNTSYLFSFGHGVEIRPTLMSVMAGDTTGSPVKESNHLDTQQKCDMVANWVINGLEQMSPLMIDYSDDVEKTYRYFNKVKPE